jgi:uncharacterized cupredoxin-like copper-binding protein
VWAKRCANATVRTALLPLILLMVACEAPGVPHPLAGSVAPAPSGATTATAASETATPDDGSTAGPLVFEGRVEIELADFKITPNELTVKAGEIVFAFNNNGRYTHDFRIEGQGIDVKAPKIGARRSREWSATLTPGTYRISCPISNHDQRGMEGTLIVVD